MAALRPTLTTKCHNRFVRNEEAKSGTTLAGRAMHGIAGICGSAAYFPFFNGHEQSTRLLGM